MPNFEQNLQKLFDKGSHFLAALSERWQKHGNRRTLAAVLILGVLSTLLYVYAIQPPDSFPLQTLVSVPEGESLKDVADTLGQDEVVRSPFMFRVLVTLMGQEKSVHAGDYLFTEPLDVFSVARALAIGQYGLEPARIRIPEGATTKQMAVIFGNRLLRFNEDSFLSQATPQEGYLFPDTYFFLPNATEKTVIEAMRQNFDQKVASIQPQIASSTHSLHDTVIMASILEREAYNTDDRRMIAGVLWNRINRGMPLQVDATFAYTIGKGTFQLTMKDLTTPSPYNTYVNKGLPPTPIGSPSLDSLTAAVTPTKNDFLYFLADKHGVTHFCKNYACQLANKARYF